MPARGRRSSALRAPGASATPGVPWGRSGGTAHGPSISAVGWSYPVAPLRVHAGLDLLTLLGPCSLWEHEGRGGAPEPVLSLLMLPSGQRSGPPLDHAVGHDLRKPDPPIASDRPRAGEPQ